MGIKGFSKKMFPTILRENYKYIGIIAMVTALIFNCVNIAENELIIFNNYNQNETMQRGVLDHSSGSLEVMQITITPQTVQLEILMIAVIIMAIFTWIANDTFMKKRASEFAFIVLNGGTAGNVFSYMSYISSRLYLIGLGIGLLVGILSAPIFNFFIYKIINIDAPILSYEILSVYMATGFMMVNWIFAIMLGLSYVYQKEIIDLINCTKTKAKKDTRQFKVPAIIYLLVYLVPFMILFIPESMGDSSGGAYMAVFISMAGSIGMINLYLPSKAKFLNNRKFLFNKQRKVYINEGIAKLRGSVLYILGVFCSLNYFIKMIVEYGDFGGSLGTIIYGLVATSIVIAVTFLNKVLDESQFTLANYKNLYKMGYPKEDILGIAKKSMLTNIAGVLLIPLLPILTYMYVSIKSGVVSIGLMMFLLAIIVIPMSISAIILYYKTNINVEEILKGDLNAEVNSERKILEEVA